MRLLLSGGGHRGSLGAVGAIGYFLWSESTHEAGSGRGDTWSDVSEVVSVSGGSLVNAALAAAPGEGVDETAARLAAFRRRLLHDRLMPWVSIRRVCASAALVLMFIVMIAALSAASGLTPPDTLSRSPWSVLIGLATFPIVIAVGRRILTWYLVDSAMTITGGRRAPLSSTGDGRRHVIAASGLASGVPYYFTAGGRPLDVTWGAVLNEGYTTGDAAVASSSLPGVGLIRAPKRYRREYLIDGGVTGVFGEQVDDTLARRPEDTWRSEDEMFAVDAARHLVSDSAVGRVSRSVSFIALLSRWLKVSLEATYVNDLIDLGDRKVARMCLPNAAPSEATPSIQTYRDGTLVVAAIDQPPPGELRHRLEELQGEVSRIGLTSLNEATAATAITVGFVSTLEVRVGLSSQTIEDGLAWLGDRLGIGADLNTAWNRAYRTTSATSPTAAQSAG